VAIKTLSLTLVLPFYKERNELGIALSKIKSVYKRFNINQIVLAQNGISDEDSFDFKYNLDSFSPEVISYTRNNHAGIGHGYVDGISIAANDYTLLSASDLPFEFSDLESFYKQSLDPETIYVGSKWHKESKIYGYGKLRTIQSYLFYFLRLLLWGRMTIKDTQGTIIVKTSLAKELVKKINNRDFLFSTELIQRHICAGGRVIELPIVFKGSSRKSSVHLLKDPIKMLIGTILLWIKLRCKAT
jgi:hypothetical protein